MKINISLEENISNFENVNPLNGGDIFNLDQVCGNNESTLIQGVNILNLIPLDKIRQTINHYISKLRHGGILRLGGIDGRETSRLFIYGLMNTEEWNKRIFGTQQTPWHFHRSSFDIFEISKIFIDCGLKITFRNNSDGYMIIEGVRE